MTAAPESSTSFGSRGWAAAPSASWIVRTVQRWHRVLAVLGICLPIPIFAATGLSVPLPATVERLAAALVPWAGDATLADTQAFSVGENGSIVRAPGEDAGVSEGQSMPSSAVADPRLQWADNPSRSNARPHAGGSAPTGEGTGPASGGGGEPSKTGGEGQSGDPGPSSGGSGPVQGAVDTVVQGTAPVVGAVEGTAGDTGVGDIVEGVGEAAEDTAGTVDGIVTGVGN
jgi:hypothetical protein